METDILQPINIELTGNNLTKDDEIYVKSTNNLDSHVTLSSNNGNSDISNKLTSSCESSSCSSNSFQLEPSEVKMVESVINDDMIDSFGGDKVDNKMHSSRIKNEGTPVINDISNPTKHIKIDTRQVDDNNFDRGALSNNDSIINNNKNTEK